MNLNSHMAPKVFTIGHSNHLFSTFLELIQKHDINLVADVRTNPYSKHSPHFNKKPLQKSLEESLIKYVYLGKNMGGKPRDKKFYHNHELIYHRLEKDEKYQEALNELIKLTEKNQIVIMCSEEDPKACQQHNLIVQSLLKKGFEISHIRGHGDTDKVEMDFQARLV